MFALDFVNQSLGPIHCRSEMTSHITSKQHGHHICVIWIGMSETVVVWFGVLPHPATLTFFYLSSELQAILKVQGVRIHTPSTMKRPKKLTRWKVHTQQQSPRIVTFLVGDPLKKSHLPLESWEGEHPNVWIEVVILWKQNSKVLDPQQPAASNLGNPETADWWGCGGWTPGGCVVDAWGKWVGPPNTVPGSSRTAEPDVGCGRQVGFSRFHQAQVNC